MKMNDPNHKWKSVCAKPHVLHILCMCCEKRTIRCVVTCFYSWKTSPGAVASSVRVHGVSTADGCRSAVRNADDWGGGEVRINLVIINYDIVSGSCPDAENDVENVSLRSLVVSVFPNSFMSDVL